MQGRMCSPVYLLQPLCGLMCIGHGQGGCRILHKLNSAWLEKIDVKAHTISQLFRVGLCKKPWFIDVQVYSCMYRFRWCTYKWQHCMYKGKAEVYGNSRFWLSAIEHGQQWRIANPRLAWHIQITVRRATHSTSYWSGGTGSNAGCALSSLSKVS